VASLASPGIVMTHTFPVGTTEPQDFAIFSNGDPFVGTAITVGIEVYTETGVAVAPAPSAAWLNQIGGTVQVTDLEALTVGNYRVRFRLSDSGGSIGYAPNGQPAMQWAVVERWA